MGKKKKSKSKERPIPDIEARKEAAESVKSLGESKTIKCDKCNHIMNFKNELTVDKKGGVKVSCVPCMFSYKKKQINILIFRKEQMVIWLLKLTNI